MADSIRSTVAERLYWSYANLAMAEKAVHDGHEKYSRTHFMIRARLYSGLMKGKMSPASLMKDQRIRMKLPQECIYCGSLQKLSIDHIVPTTRGGADIGDNAIWACRKCNSSKSGKDLFAWWFVSRSGFPPLFAVRVYLKQAIAYCVTNRLMGQNWAAVDQIPFDFASIPEDFPAPSQLTFSPFHSRK